MPKKVTILKSRTADALIEKLGQNQGAQGTTPLGAIPSGHETSNFYGKIVSETGKGEYKVKEVILNNEDADPDNWTYDDIPDVTEVDAYELSAATGIEEDKVFNFKLDYTKEGVRWVFQQGGGGGAALVYLEITGSTDINTYTAQIYDNPVDLNPVGDPITVKAIQHDAGTLPNSPSGKGPFATLVGGVYYLTNYSVFYGD